MAADTPITEVARLMSVRPSRLRDALTRLQTSGLVISRTLVDVYRLGYFDSAVYLRTTANLKHERESLFKQFRASDNVPTVIELVGDYQMMFSVVAESHHQLANQLLPELCKTTQKYMIIDRVVVPRSQWFYFPPKFLASKAKAAVSAVSFGSKADKIKLDTQDLAILRSIARDSVKPSAWHARNLKLPTTTLDYRLARLREKKVIVGAGYFFNFALLKYECFIIKLHEQTSDSSSFEKLLNFCTSHPNVSNLIQCVGPWSYELSIQVRHASEVHDILEDLRCQFGQRFVPVKTSRVTSLQKLSLCPF